MCGRLQTNSNENEAFCFNVILINNPTTFDRLSERENWILLYKSLASHGWACWNQGCTAVLAINQTAPVVFNQGYFGVLLRQSPPFLFHVGVLEVLPQYWLFSQVCTWINRWRKTFLRLAIRHLYGKHPKYYRDSFSFPAASKFTWEFCLDKIEPLLSCFKSARHELELFCLDKYSPSCSDLLWLFAKICLDDWMLSWLSNEFLETLESCLSSICRDKLLFCLDNTLCFLSMFDWS